jgi:hypothetical protein
MVITEIEDGDEGIVSAPTHIDAGISLMPR